MANAIIDTFDLWTTAQNLKTSNRGLSASNQNLLGIKKLRELILELAMQGKLLPQDSNDESADILLGKIEKEKLRLIKKGEIRKPKRLPEITDEEIPFKLPNGWSFCRMNELGDWGAGATPNRGRNEYYGGNIPWFKSGELNGDYINQSEEFVTELALKETSLRYNKIGDVLIAMYGATIGKTSILEIQATTNQAVCACTPFPGISNVFLLTLLKAYKSRFIGMGAGGAQPNISREKLIATVIALPPLAEQNRIVSKVDELMALCDLLEQQQTSSNEAHQTLVDTLLGTLTNAKSPEDFDKAWQRIASHFDTLLTTEHSIDQLKQTILQLAVMGKLVSQNTDDEPASELLKRIAKEKKRLIENNVIKKEKLDLESTGIKNLFLPNNWRFVYLQDITSVITCGIASTPKYFESGRIFLSAKNVKPFRFLPENHQFVDEETYRKIVSWGAKPEKGDILLTRVGAGIGEAAIIDQDIDFAYYVSLTLIKPIQPFINSKFLLLWTNSTEGVNKALESIYGRGVSQGNLNVNQVRKFVIPIPPQREQQRIVSKVDELFALCDSLKERLRDAQALQNQLAVSVVEQAV
jgi:type I restriction enzyme S subunit